MTTMILATLIQTNTPDLQTMLTDALKEEYLAHATYQAVMVDHGNRRPFSNIIKAEAQHMKMVGKLMESRGWELPKDTYRRQTNESDKDFTTRLKTPKTWQDALKRGLEIENEDVDFLTNALKDQTLPKDVKTTFNSLLVASRDRHAVAFKRALGQ